MRKKLFCLLLCIPILLTGCQLFRVKDVTTSEKSIILSTGKQGMDRCIKIPEGNWSEDISEDREQFVISDNVQPESKTGEKMDFRELDKLDNKQYAWWIELNKQNQPTTIPKIAQTMIERYHDVYIGDPTKKNVYLTFDEGYENGYTPKILDTLKANDVKALFFVTGPYIKSYGNLVERMLEEGHLVGNHTINHLSLPTLSGGALEKELYGLEKEFTALTGKAFKYIRPPRGEYSEKVLGAANQLGYTTVFWSFAYRDFDVNNQKGADHAYKMVMDNLHNGAVILLHAVSSDNAEALDRIIKGIKAQGYTLSLFAL